MSRTPEHVQQWRKASLEAQDALVDQWLNTMWRIGSVEGVLKTINAEAYIVDHIEPAFEIEVVSPDDRHGFPVYIRAHFEQFSPVLEK